MVESNPNVSEIIKPERLEIYRRQAEAARRAIVAWPDFMKRNRNAVHVPIIPLEAIPNK